MITSSFKLAEHMVTISELSRGLASKVLKNLLKTGEPYFITKNSKLEAVMLTMKDYEALLETQENYSLLLTAQERIKNAKDEDYLPYEELLEEFDIKTEELEGIEIEFE